MKYFSILMAGLLLSNCAAVAPYTPEERCAMQNMKLEGVSVGSGSGVGYGLNGTVTVDSSYYGVNCAVTRTPADVCDISVLRESARPKLEYNSTVGAKRFITGLGYLGFFMPGLLMKVVFDAQLDHAVAESEEIRSSAGGRCGGLTQGE